jgi:hypothetical protein
MYVRFTLNSVDWNYYPSRRDVPIASFAPQKDSELFAKSVTDLHHEA